MESVTNRKAATAATKLKPSRRQLLEQEMLEKSPLECVVTDLKRCNNVILTGSKGINGVASPLFSVCLRRTCQRCQLIVAGAGACPSGPAGHFRPRAIPKQRRPFRNPEVFVIPRTVIARERRSQRSPPWIELGVNC